MSKNGKKLLNENTIRRFMKLAEIDSLSDSFVSDKFTIGEQEEEPFEADEMGAEEGEIEEPELPPEPEMAPEEGGEADVAELTGAVEALMGVVSRMTGVDIDVGGEEEAPEEELPVEEPVEEFPEEGGEEELPPGNRTYEALEKEEIELKEDEDEGDEKLEEKLTNEIARRVAARLVKESRQDKMAGRLAERITRRLKNG